MASRIALRRALIRRLSQKSGTKKPITPPPAIITKPSARLSMQDAEDEEAEDRPDDGRHGLEAQEVARLEVAGVARLGQPPLRAVRLLGAGDALDGAREAHGQRSDGALEEGLLELELLEVLGLHRAELGEPGLDRVDRLAAGEADDDEDDGRGGDAGDDEG